MTGAAPRQPLPAALAQERVHGPLVSCAPRNCPHQCSQSSPPRAAARTTRRWRASSACSRRSSGMAGTGRTGPRPLHRGARGLDRSIQYGEAQRCARWPHAGRVPLRAGKGRVTVQEIVRSPHSCPFGTASCWGVPAPNPARNEYSKLELIYFVCKSSRKKIPSVRLTNISLSLIT